MRVMCLLRKYMCGTRVWWSVNLYLAPYSVKPSEGTELTFINVKIYLAFKDIHGPEQTSRHSRNRGFHGICNDIPEENCIWWSGKWLLASHQNPRGVTWLYFQIHLAQPRFSIRSSDNDSTGFWPPGSLHTMGAGGHIQQRDRLFMWIKILCIEYILWGIPRIESTFDVANMVQTATVKDVSINDDALLNIQAC